MDKRKMDVERRVNGGRGKDESWTLMGVDGYVVR